MIKLCYSIIPLLFFVQFSFSQGKTERRNRSAHAFSFQVNEHVKTDIKLEYNAAGNPLYYTSHLATDVCSDGLCKPISITIQWNLLGQFNAYQTDEEHELTKFDHIVLTAEDHKKLHSILSDTSSILRDYKVEDMIDTTSTVYSLKLDAVTGATSKTFDGVTVEGALYTVYTLWHFVNGDVRKEMLKHTQALISDAFVLYMMNSKNRDEVGFIFENMSDSQRQKFLPEIIKLVSNPDDYIPHFALAQLRDKTLANYAHQHLLLSYFPSTASSVQNALLERFKMIKLDSESLELLINSIPSLNATQINKAFAIVENNKAAFNQKLIRKLEILAKNENKAIAQKASRLL
jgi:hypothetical protein